MAATQELALHRVRAADDSSGPAQFDQPLQQYRRRARYTRRLSQTRPASRNASIAFREHLRLGTVAQHAALEPRDNVESLWRRQYGSRPGLDRRLQRASVLWRCRV